jgi:hypothetical protein
VTAAAAPHLPLNSYGGRSPAIVHVDARCLAVRSRWAGDSGRALPARLKTRSRYANVFTALIVSLSDVEYHQAPIRRLRWTPRRLESPPSGLSFCGAPTRLVGGFMFRTVESLIVEHLTADETVAASVRHAGRWCLGRPRRPGGEVIGVASKGLIQRTLLFRSHLAIASGERLLR